MAGDRTPAAGTALPGVEDFLDPDWYRRTYPETAGIDPLTHFLEHGEAEGRSPGPGFDAHFYASTYLALEQTHALRHYLTRGRQAGHRPRPVLRPPAESRAVMATALAGAQPPIVLVGNDAQRAGAPLLLLEVSRHLRRRGWAPVFLLRRAGPLAEAFRAVGPLIVEAEGHDLTGLGSALDPGTPILGNTGWAAPILEGLGHPGPTLLLIHEMPDYLDREGLLPAVGRAPSVVAGFPAVADALRARLPVPARITSVLPGLLHAVGGPARSGAVGRQLTDGFGAGRTVVLGAGFADRRKGFDRFLDLAGRVHALEPATGFVWLGDLSSWARELADEAVAAGLPLLLPGFRLDAAAWYDHADVYLLTSRQDPGPTTVLDAARRGVPFVAAPGDLGLQSLGRLLDGVGEFVPEDEIPARVVSTIRAGSPERRAARARHVENHAGFARYVDDLLALLRGEGLTGEPGSSPPPQRSGS